MYVIRDVMANEDAPGIECETVEDVARELFDICYIADYPPSYNYVTAYYCIELNGLCVCHFDKKLRATFDSLIAEEDR